MNRTWKKRSKWKRLGEVLILGTFLLIVGIYIGNHFQQKAEKVNLTEAEKAAHPALSKAKIITLDKIKGAFNGEVLKLTGFEETNRHQIEQVTDVVREMTVDTTDSLWVKKGKEWFNGANTRELTANFSIDYGLGFDMYSLLEHGIWVDEYKGIVTIDTPTITFTHFYIDPAYHLQEENGVIVSIFQHGFSAEEKSLLIQKMEERIKQVIMEDEQIQQKALEATKTQLKKLLEDINPRITVQFR